MFSIVWNLLGFCLFLGIHFKNSRSPYLANPELAYIRLEENKPSIQKNKVLHNHEKKVLWIANHFLNFWRQSWKPKARNSRYLELTIDCQPSGRKERHLSRAGCFFHRRVGTAAHHVRFIFQCLRVCFDQDCLIKMVLMILSSEKEADVRNFTRIQNTNQLMEGTTVQRANI